MILKKNSKHICFVNVEANPRLQYYGFHMSIGGRWVATLPSTHLVHFFLLLYLKVKVGQVLKVSIVNFFWKVKYFRELSS